MKPASYWKDQLCNRFIINTKDNVIEEFIAEVQKDSKLEWQPPETFPKDRIVLIKTKTGIVSGQWFDGEWSSHHEYGDEYNPPVISCYDDDITLECEWNEDKTHYFPDVLGWMEIPLK